MDVGNNNINNNSQVTGLLPVNVLEEELQEKGAMFRDFLTSRVKGNNFLIICLHLLLVLRMSGEGKESILV